MKNQGIRTGFLRAWVVYLLVVCTSACKETTTVKSPPGYDLSKPGIYKMPEELNEISGIVFKNGLADTLLAIQDEYGKLYQLHLGDDKISDIRFAKKGDYEDVSFCNGVVIILCSDGRLLTFLSNNNGQEPMNVNEFKDLVPGREYESMYADEKNNLLYILCKDCNNGKNNESINGYVIKIDLQGNLSRVGEFSINEKEIEQYSGINKINLKASAMAKNIHTQEWYIISSVNKLLTVTDSSWKVKNIYPLSPLSLFTQPEGIAFDNNGNLYISNEKGKGNSATILKFSYQGK